MPLMEKRERDIFREPVFFSISSPFDVEQSVPLAIWFKKKKMQCACAHTLVTLCSVKEWGRGKGKNRETVL